MAKIIGNTTATPNPRPDWNQTDNTKADYIKNKPVILTEEDVLGLIGNNAIGKDTVFIELQYTASNGYVLIDSSYEEISEFINNQQNVILFQRNSNNRIEYYIYVCLDGASSSLRHTFGRHKGASWIEIKVDPNGTIARTTYDSATEQYVDDAINDIDEKISLIPKFSISVVTELPLTDISNTTVYLVKDTEKEGNMYTEYIYVNDNWETLGSQNFDLSDYAKLTDIPNNKDILDNFSYVPGGDSYSVSYGGVQLATVYHLMNYPTKEELEEAISNIGDGSGSTERTSEEIELSIWFEETEQKLLLGADEIDLDPSLVGKEIADVIFITNDGEVSIKDMAEIDQVPYISMFNHFVAGEIQGSPVTLFAGIYYIAERGWLYNQLLGYAIQSIKIIYYTD